MLKLPPSKPFASAPASAALFSTRRAIFARPCESSEEGFPFGWWGGADGVWRRNQALLFLCGMWKKWTSRNVEHRPRSPVRTACGGCARSKQRTWGSSCRLTSYISTRRVQCDHIECASVTRLVAVRRCWGLYLFRAPASGPPALFASTCPGWLDVAALASQASYPAHSKAVPGCDSFAAACAGRPRVLRSGRFRSQLGVVVEFAVRRDRVVVSPWAEFRRQSNAPHSRCFRRPLGFRQVVA